MLMVSSSGTGRLVPVGGPELRLYVDACAGLMTRSAGWVGSVAGHEFGRSEAVCGICGGLDSAGSRDGASYGMGRIALRERSSTAYGLASCGGCIDGGGTLAAAGAELL